jgi:hypothetical protein
VFCLHKRNQPWASKVDASRRSCGAVARQSLAYFVELLAMWRSIRNLMVKRTRAHLLDGSAVLRRILLLATAILVVSSCNCPSCDETLLWLPLDGHCGGLSLHVQGSSGWCNLNQSYQFVSLHIPSPFSVFTRQEFCSGLTLTVPAGVHELSISLHNEPPANLELCEGCPCSSRYFVADPLLNGPDLFSRLLLASGFTSMQRVLSQIQNADVHGVDLVLGLHAGIEDSRLMIFLKSLRSSCTDCFIVLFCREISPSAQRILIRTKAWCIQYDFWLANSTLGPAGDHRFAMYSNFLALAGSSVRRVFLSDVRDVAFQGSPFDSLELDPLDVVFFLEDKRRLIQVNRFCFH